MSPRRWGKSSLIHKAAQIAVEKNNNYRFCFIDLFNIRDEKEFYSVFIKELIKVTSTKPEEWLKSARQFLKRITISQKKLQKVKKIIICIDDIQNTAREITGKAFKPITKLSLPICSDNGL